MGLEEVAQDVADELQLPVVIFDTEMRVVAFSTHDSTVDSARKGIILTRRGSARSVEMIAEFHVGSARQPVRLPARDDVPSRILAPLRHNGRLVGYLSCLDADDQLDLLPSQLEILENAAQKLGELLAMRTLDESGDRERARDLLERLVSESAETRSAAAREAIDGGHLARADDYSLVMLDDIQATGSPSSRSRLAVEGAAIAILRSSGGGALGVGFSRVGSMLVIPGAVDRGKVTRVLDRPEFGDIRSGEGSRRAVTDLFASRHEAAIALRFAMLGRGQTTRSSVWSDLGLDALLIQLPLETLGVADLPAALRVLFAVPNAAVLVPTLETYLRAGGDARETARRLLIHRSTLYYRLDKITALTGVDLSDGGIRRELHTGLRVAELAGLWIAPATS